MKCPRCNFENIPGKTRCFRCDSVLEISATKKIEVHPPRMPQWKRPFRAFFRKIRNQKLLPDTDLSLQWKNHPNAGKAITITLDLIPGLGHFVSGSLKKIWWLIIIWLLLVASAVFFLPRPLGFMLIGFAAAVHVYIITRRPLFKDIPSFKNRLAIAFVLLILLLLIYRLVPMICLPWLTGGYITFTVPADNIERNDFLLASRNFDRNSLQRGSLVVVQPYGAANNQRLIGQVIAFPGENIKWKDNSFEVNGQILDNRKYPVPGWLRDRLISIKISNDRYFINLEYSAHGRLNGELLRNACLYNATDIEALAFMRWLPISKRGFLR